MAGERLNGPWRLTPDGQRETRDGGTEWTRWLRVRREFTNSFLRKSVLLS